MISAFLLLACAPTPSSNEQPKIRVSRGKEAPAPTPKKELPQAKGMVEGPSFSVSNLTFAPASDLHFTPRKTELPLAEYMASLEQVLAEHTTVLDNPWAVGHGMMVYGAQMKLVDGSSAVEHLFSNYAEIVEVDGARAIDFPTIRGDIRIEPHRDLQLKSLVEAGIPPNYKVVVQGQPFEAKDLLPNSLAHFVVIGDKALGGWNDTPWALTGFAGWLDDSANTQWTVGQQKMSMNQVTHASVLQLRHENRAFASALQSKVKLDKVKFARQGIFGYTCGGQHLIQGTGYAVARGFGAPGDREEMKVQIDLLFSRFAMELESVDRGLTTAKRDSPLALVLLAQRLKFTGHFVETTHKFAAMGLLEVDEETFQKMEVGVAELARTIRTLSELGILRNIHTIRTQKSVDVIRDSEQVALDLIGDSAHALNGLNLALGKTAVRL